MDLFTAMQERRSCRNFLTDAIEDEQTNKILEAATWAPSPLNGQPWEFIVITGLKYKKQIQAEATRCRDWAVDESGWKWLGGYPLDFLETVPLIVAVVGDIKKTGMDQFQAEGNVGYQHACAAAIQNMLLAAHADGLGGLWFTMYDKANMRQILTLEEGKTPLALICIGRPAKTAPPVKRAKIVAKTKYLR